MSAVLLSVAVLLAALAIRRPTPAIGVYLGASPPRSRPRLRLPSPGSAATGAVLGAIAALAVDPSKLATLAVIGSMAGLMVSRAIRSTASERRSARLAQELPTVADTIALHVLAGESVVTALDRFTKASTCVASQELEAVRRSDRPLDEALRIAARETAHPEASRLYDLLAHAHRTGGGLADALTALATDFRASLTRDLTAEGGRRALTTYGPILALMVPVTLLFLMYPTLAGLNALSSTP
jgi:tight adherence protein C